MADIKAGGAFVEVSVADKTGPGAAAVQKNLAAMAKSAQKSAADMRAALILGGSGLANLDGSRLASAGGLMGRALTEGFKGQIKGLGGIAKAGILSAVPAVKSAGLLLAAAASVGVAAVANSFQKLGALSDTAARIGISTKALQGLQFAGEQAGVEAEALNKGLTKLQVGLDAAANGGGPIKALQSLRLDAAALQKLPVDEALGKIADALNQVNNPAERAALAMDIFGKSGADLLPMLSAGSEGLRAAAKESEALGNNLSDIEVAQVEAAGDAIDKLKTAFGAVIDKLAVKLAPSILAAADALTDFASNSKALDFVLPVLEGIVQGLLFVRSAYTGAQAIVAGSVGFIITSMADWGESIAAVLNLIPGVQVAFGQGLRSLGDDLIAESVRLAKKSGQEFNNALDFKLPPLSATVDVKTKTSPETIAELVAAAEAAKNLREVMAETGQNLADFSLSAVDKALAETGKKYDDLITKVQDAAAKTQDAALQAAAAEQVRQIQVAKGIAIEKTRADLAAKAAAEEQARQDAFTKAISDARAAVGNLTPQSPVDAAVADATAKYQAIIDRLAEAGAKAAADAASATDQAAKESAQARALAIQQEIVAVRQAEVDGIARAREAGGLAAEEIRRQVADIQAGVAEAQKAVAKAGGIGGISANLGGFDAAALARQSTLAFNDPQLTEAKKATKQLQDANFELKKLNQKEGLAFA